MDAGEYEVVSRVFGNTLPDRKKIIVTNAAGLQGRAFTIPMALLSGILGVSAPAFHAALRAFLGDSLTDAFIISVGGNYNNLNTTERGLLVHETAHVWQGHNRLVALSYVFESCLDQCVFGKAAYTYKLGRPWMSYKVEQQASIIMDWFLDLEPTYGDRWKYISEYVRRGIC